MPEIPVGAQIFDVLFHPTSAIAYTALLTGHVKAFAYDQQGDSHNLFSVRPSKRSCRGLSLNKDGSKLYAVGKSKALHTIDATTTTIETRSGAHDCAINRVKCLMPWTVATGDDDGTVKLWDPRKQDCVKTYTQHFDYISDFLWLADKKQLVATSGDGTLSVMDIRSKEAKPIAHSEDQEDDLLSIVSIKKNQKILVGTQLGMISVFNRKKGWGDCVDRIPGHPLSIDALCNIPDDFPGVDGASTVLTGSSDGFVRAVQILPTKFLGVVADHGEFPVEHIAVGSGVDYISPPSEAATPAGRSVNVKNKSDDDEDDGASGEKRWWVGSVGHDEVLRMTDLGAFFEENGEDSDEADSDEEGEWEGISDGDEDDAEPVAEEKKVVKPQAPAPSKQAVDSDEEDEQPAPPQPVKRKRKEQEVVETKRTKKGKKETVVDTGFFDGL